MGVPLRIQGYRKFPIPGTPGQVRSPGPKEHESLIAQLNFYFIINMASGGRKREPREAVQAQPGDWSACKLVKRSD